MIQGEKGDEGAAGTDGEPGIPVSFFHHHHHVFFFFVYLCTIHLFHHSFSLKRTLKPKDITWSSGQKRCPSGIFVQNVLLKVQCLSFDRNAI